MRNTTIVIGVMFTTCYNMDGEVTKAMTGNSAQVEWMIREAQTMGFIVYDCRVWAAEEHACGGFLVAD